jgi:nicotinic acid mononucleotide adenylyltransferase
LNDYRVHSSFEVSTPGIGTAELLEFLTSSEQGTEFSLALGEDAFRDLIVYHKWKRSKDILTILSDRPWFVFKRPTTDEAIPIEINEQCSNVHWWKFSDPELNGLSSTQVRSMRTLEEWEKVVPPLVMDYVVTNRLYSFCKNDAGISLVNG